MLLVFACLPPKYYSKMAICSPGVGRLEKLRDGTQSQKATPFTSDALGTTSSLQMPRTPV